MGFRLCEKCPNTDFFSGLYFPAFGLDTEKYGPEKPLYLDAFHAVLSVPFFPRGREQKIWKNAENILIYEKHIRD